MRWLTFLISMGVALTCQSAVAPAIEVFGVRPDWILVLVVFFAMFARPGDAAVGAWLVGLAADLMTIERLGFLALSYTLVAIGVSSIRGYLFCFRGTTQFVVTFIVCVLLQCGWLVYRYAMYGSADALIVDILRHVLLTSIYTAVWAPLLHKFMLSAARWLGLPRPKYSHVGLQGMSRAGV